MDRDGGRHTHATRAAAITTLLHFTGPPMPITARMRSTPIAPLPLFSTRVQLPAFSPTSLSPLALAMCYVRSYAMSYVMLRTLKGASTAPVEVSVTTVAGTHATRAVQTPPAGLARLSKGVP
eukprot:9179842-Pyramimonas_sp.AAC.1